MNKMLAPLLVPQKYGHGLPT